MLKGPCALLGGVAPWGEFVFFSLVRRRLAISASALPRRSDLRIPFILSKVVSRAPVRTSYVVDPVFRILVRLLGRFSLGRLFGSSLLCMHRILLAFLIIFRLSCLGMPMYSFPRMVTPAKAPSVSNCSPVMKDSAFLCGEFQLSP